MSRHAVVAGPDESGVGDALETEGIAVGRVDGAVTAEALAAAGIEGAVLFVLTDPTEATAIPLVRDTNPDAGVVVYSRQSLPEFARGMPDFAIDPALVEPAVLVEEFA